MRTDEPPASADQAFLDAVFDEAVSRIEEGAPLDVGEWARGHETLLPQIEEMLHLAQQVAVGPPRATPHIPGYTILHELGRGGMGAVYLAQQQSLGNRAVALKLLPPAFALSRFARQRFRAEAESIARLNHPNIVAVHDVVDSGEVHAYAMEYIDGVSLYSVIEHLRALPAAQRGPDAVREYLDSPPDELAQGTYTMFICRIGIAVARALGAVHQAGLLHRDVKPQNILLRRDGTPLLSDFGLARDVAHVTLTHAGHFLGTPAYAAPEQLRGETTQLDARTDVYALGVTLYHALSFEFPATGDTPGEVLRQIERGAVPPLRKRDPRLPTELQTIVSKAMDADPARRYATANELADDLERLLSLQPIRARPAGLLTHISKAARRNRRSLFGAIAGGVVALALATLVVIYWFLAPGWVAQHVREARLSLLRPGMTDNMIAATLWNAPRGDSIPDGPGEDFIRTALTHYARAQQMAPFDASIHGERLTVEIARDIVADGQPSPERLRELERQAPHAAEFAGAWSTGPGMPPVPLSDDLAGADDVDLRALGLLAYVLNDAQTALVAWGQYDERDIEDPLVEGALGFIYLARDEPQRAYPRLRDACQAFPEAGFLHVALADAAFQCGDVQRAEALLNRAEAMPGLDDTAGLRRVRADLYAATGRVADAVAIWQVPGSIVASCRYAEYLESQGDWAAATIRYGTAGWAYRYERARHGFWRVAPRWWAELTPTQRWQTLRNALDQPLSGKPLASLFWILCRLGVDTLPPSSVTPRVLAHEVYTGPCGDSAGSLARIAFANYAGYTCWNGAPLLDAPPWIKNCYATALVSPWPVAGVHAVRAIASARQRLGALTERILGRH